MSLKHEQERLLEKTATILTVGVVSFALIVFYPFMAWQIRLVLVPSMVFLAWLVGGRIGAIWTGRNRTAKFLQAVFKEHVLELPPRQRRLLIRRTSRAVFLGVGTAGVLIALPFISSFPYWIAIAQVIYLSWCLAGLAADIVWRTYFERELDG